MDSYNVLCEDCQTEWDQDEQEAHTSSMEPPERCVYCGSVNIIVEVV